MKRYKLNEKRETNKGITWRYRGAFKTEAECKEIINFTNIGCRHTVFRITDAETNEIIYEE